MALDASGQVRLLISDVGTGEDQVFTDEEIGTFLTLEGGKVKLAAARALVTLASNEALVSKVIRDGTLATDGAKVAAELRAQAKDLRDSHDREVSESDADGYFGIVNMASPGRRRGPELTGGW